MKSKGILWVLVLIIIAVGGYFFMNNQNSEDAMTEDDSMMTEDDVMMEGDDVMMESDDVMMEDGENTSGETMMETEADVVIDITGKSFEFSTTEIVVAEGETVTINFESTQGFHDWVVDEFDAATKQVNPGEQTSVTFTADKKGTFEFYCSVGQHREQGMVGTLIVE